MRLSLFIACFSIFLLSINAFVGPYTYYSFGSMWPGYATNGATVGGALTGVFLITYNGATKEFQYQVISTLTVIGSVNLKGPASCITAFSSYPNYASSYCIGNTAPLIRLLGTGAVVKAGATTAAALQLFEGTFTLTSAQEEMLFNSEMYIEVTTLIAAATGSGQTEIPALRGAVNIFSFSSWYYYSNMNLAGDVNSIVAFMQFGPNTGKFSGATTKTTNSGFGIVIHDPTTTDFYYVVYHTIQEPGALILVCGGVQQTVAKTGTNPFSGTFTFPTTTAGLLMEMFVPNQCFMFISSAQFPNGELFSSISLSGQYSISMNGNGVSPPVVSAYYGEATAQFDDATKMLDIVVKTNLTQQTITNSSIIAGNGTVACYLQQTIQNVLVALPFHSYCFLTPAWVTELNNNNLYISVATSLYPKGEIQGKFVTTGTAASSSSGLSQSAKIGLGVGLTIGILALIGIIVGVVFFMKKHPSSKI